MTLTILCIHLLLYTLLPCALIGMTKQEKEKLISELTHKTLAGYQRNEQIIKVTLDTLPSARYFYLHNNIKSVKNGLSYCSLLLIDHPEKHELEELALQYLLFDIAAYGQLKNFMNMQTLENNIKKTDCRFKPLLFIFKKENGDYCTSNDLDKGNAVSLEKTDKPFFGINTYGWNLADHAKHRTARENVQALFIKDSSLFCTQEQKNPEFIAQLLQKHAQENEQILKAQKENTIPTLMLEPRNQDEQHPYESTAIPIKNAQEEQISSCISKEMVKIFYRRDTKKNRNPPILDLDAFPILYAFIIGFNEKEGQRITHAVTHWKNFPLFCSRVLCYLNFIIQDQLHAPENVIAENILSLAHNTIKELANSPDKHFLHHYLATTLRYCVWQEKDPRFHRSYHDLLKLMIANQETKALLKNACEENPEFFNKTVKPKMSEALWRNYISTQLHHRHENDHDVKKPSQNLFKILPREIVEYIVSFWSPMKERVLLKRKKLSNIRANIQAK